MGNELIDKYDLKELKEIEDFKFEYKGFVIHGPYFRENGPLSYYQSIIYNRDDKRIGEQQDRYRNDSLKFAMRYIDSCLGIY